MRVSREPWHDWYVQDGESAVFVGDAVAVLSELATTLVELVGDGTDLETLARGLSAAFGPPEGDPLEVTHTRVAELVSSGILALAQPVEAAT